MSSVEDGAPGLRRVPAQERSRRRVEAILDATARVAVQEGVAEMTTRSIAVEAGVPPASVYQYYADREAVLLDMVARDMTRCWPKSSRTSSSWRTSPSTP